MSVESLLLVGTPGTRLPLSDETKRRIARVKRAKKFARLLPCPIRRSIESRYEKLGSEDYRNAGPMRPILVKTNLVKPADPLLLLDDAEASAIVRQARSTGLTNISAPAAIVKALFSVKHRRRTDC